MFAAVVNTLSERSLASVGAFTVSDVLLLGILVFCVVGITLIGSTTEESFYSKK